jgi:hypothetical protein
VTRIKYCDRSRGQPVDLEKDGCEYEDWVENFRDFSFTTHPKGFPIFLKPAELEASDEYNQEDPYKVEENLESGFHQRRV